MEGKVSIYISMRFLATILLLTLKSYCHHFFSSSLAAPRGMWHRSSQPGTEPVSPALEAWSFHHRRAGPPSPFYRWEILGLKLPETMYPQIPRVCPRPNAVLPSLCPEILAFLLSLGFARSACFSGVRGPHILYYLTPTYQVCRFFLFLGLLLCLFPDHFHQDGLFTLPFQPLWINNLLSPCSTSIFPPVPFLRILRFQPLHLPNCQN